MQRNLLIILTVVLILINFYLINVYTVTERRLMRLITVCVYFIALVLLKGPKNSTPYFAMVLLIITDVLNIDFENVNVSQLIPFIKVLVFAVFIKREVGKVYLLNSNTPRAAQVIFYIVITLNLTLVGTVLFNVADKINGIIEMASYLVYGIFAIGACVISVNYNFRYNTRKSLYFLYFIFAIVLSDASWFIAYFLNYYGAFYLDILLYIITLYCILLYAIEDDKVQENYLDLEA